MAEQRAKEKPAAPLLSKDKRLRLLEKLDTLDEAIRTHEHCSPDDADSLEFFRIVARKRRDEVVAYIERLLAAKRGRTRAMSEKHSPLPWRAVAVQDWHEVIGGDGMRVASMMGRESLLAGNAALIARAVNSHAALLAACEDIVADITDRFNMDSPSTNPGIKHVVEQARDAIAKAKQP